MSVDTVLAIAGLVIGLIAMVMAIPPLLQMFFGRPKIEFEADEFTGPDGKQIILSIKNRPIASRLLRMLGVTRDVANVLAYFEYSGTRHKSIRLQGRIGTVELRGDT